MIKTQLEFKPIGSHVLDVDSWTPANNGEDHEFQYIDISSVDREAKAITSPSTVTCRTAPSRARQLVQTSDVLVSTVRPNLNGVALVPGSLDGATASTGYCVLRANPELLDARYLFFWVRTDAFVREMTKKSTGASYPAVSDRIVKESLIPLPPLPEQKRIADILDKADTIRRKRHSVRDDYPRIRASVFMELFGDPMTNPLNLPVGTINDLVADVTYGTSSKAGGIGRYPILRMNNITTQGDWDLSNLKYIDLPDREIERYSVRRGDILFNRTNSKELVGKTAVFNEDTPMVYAGYLIRVRTNDLATPAYVSGYLNSPHGKAVLAHMCKSIIGMANINATELKGIRILIPPKEQQLEYEKFVDETRLAEQIAAQAASEADDLFNSLVQRAFKGEL